MQSESRARPAPAGRVSFESTAHDAAAWHAVGWTAALGIRRGRPVISLAFRGGGELVAERREGRWVVVGGTDEGLALVDRLVEAGVLIRRRPEAPDREHEHHLAAAVVESALGT